MRYGVCAELIRGCTHEGPPRSRTEAVIKPSVSWSGNGRDRALHDGTYQRYNPAAMDRIGQINVLDLRWQRIVSSYHVVDPERS